MILVPNDSDNTVMLRDLEINGIEIKWGKEYSLMKLTWKVLLDGAWSSLLRSHSPRRLL
jgi:hypothetical protein